MTKSTGHTELTGAFPWRLNFIAWALGIPSFCSVIWDLWLQKVEVKSLAEKANKAVRN